MHASHRQLLRKDGSMSAVALGVGHDLLAHRGWLPWCASILSASRYGTRCA